MMLLASSVFAGMNQDYSQLLDGRETLTDLKIAQLYNDFKNEFKTTPEGIKGLEYLSRTSNADRKAVFASALRKVIAHNKDQSQSYKKGINSFSDFT
jgi:cathepsin H